MSMEQRATPADETGDEQKANEQLNPASVDQSLAPLPAFRIPTSVSGVPIGISLTAARPFALSAAASSVDTNRMPEIGGSALAPTETLNSLGFPMPLAAGRMPTASSSVSLQPELTGQDALPTSAITSAFSPLAPLQPPNQTVSGNSRSDLILQQNLWLQQMLQSQALLFHQQQYLLGQHQGFLPGGISVPTAGIPPLFLAGSSPSAMYASALQAAAAPVSTAATSTNPVQNDPILQPSSLPMHAAAKRPPTDDDSADEESSTDEPPYDPEYKPKRPLSAYNFFL